MIRCKKCLAQKDEDEFYVYQKRGTLSTDCLTCRRQYRRNHYRKNKEMYKKEIKILNLYYQGELLQSRRCYHDEDKNKVLDMFKRMYGPRFKDCEIEYKPDYRLAKAAK